MLGASLLEDSTHTDRHTDTHACTHTHTHHHAIVSLGADDSPHALSSLPHSIKSQEVTLLDLEHLSHVLQPGPVKQTRHTLPVSLKPCQLPAVPGSAGLQRLHNVPRQAKQDWPLCIPECLCIPQCVWLWLCCVCMTADSRQLLLCVSQCGHNMLKAVIHEVCHASRCHLITRDRDASRQQLHCCDFSWA